MGDGPCVCGKSLIDRSDSSRSMMVDSDRSSSNCSHNSTTNTFTFDADEEYDSPTKVELLPGATHSCGGLHSSTSSPEKDAQHKYSSLSSNDNDERKSIAEVMKLEPDDPGVVFLLNNSQIIHNICNLPHSPVAADPNSPDVSHENFVNWVHDAVTAVIGPTHHVLKRPGRIVKGVYKSLSLPKYNILLDWFNNEVDATWVAACRVANLSAGAFCGISHRGPAENDITPIRLCVFL
eukprot:c5822_g1_i2.p1 GENE.c5822_g1_i2~~c5822_g1_i2.p1  ORF type:complete len:236 (-),score=33.88 c5822_g1_i2:48-755(-)